MKIIDNINSLLGDDLKASILPKSRLKIAASCFSIYAYEALKSELAKIESLEFIFTSPTFVPNEVTDKLRKERREFFIPKADRERSLYGSKFEIQLRNKLTQRAIARECAEWIRRKAKFRSNKTGCPMQQFACIQGPEQEFAYMPLHGFTAVDLGYQRGDAVSNIVNRVDETTFTATYLQPFDQIWNDPDKLEDVTDAICDHIASVYQENSPERIYFLMLYNIFSEFLEDVSEDVLAERPNRLPGQRSSGTSCSTSSGMRPPASSTSWKHTTAASSPTASDSARRSPRWRSSSTTSCAIGRSLFCAPRSSPTTGSTTTSNLKTNIFAKDRFSYDVLCHTDLPRTSGRVTRHAAKPG